jgi:hypothetical protein
MLRDDFKIPISFSAVKQRLNLGYKAEKISRQNEFDVRKPLMVSIAQRSEELRLCNLLQNFTFSNHCLKAVSSSAFPG